MARRKAKELDPNYVPPAEDVTYQRVLKEDSLLKGSDEQRLLVERTREELAVYDAQMLGYLEDGIEWVKRRDESENDSSNMDAMNKMYSKMLITQAVQPILHGRDADAVMQGLSVMMAGYLTNAEFRKEFNESAMKAVSPWLHKQADKHGPNSKWDQWCKKVDTSLNDGRLPLNPRSAAMMKLAIDRKAYNEMRVPGADVMQVMSDRSVSVQFLYELAETDGCDLDDVLQNERLILGHMMSVDDSVKRCFMETASGSVVKAPGERQDDGSTIWSGDFMYKNGKPFEDVFTPRPPMDADDRVKMINKSLSHAFGQCDTAEDMLQLFGVVCGDDVKLKPENAWMEGWQDRNKYQYDVMHDDCVSFSDEELLNKQVAKCTKESVDQWVKLHSDEAAKFMEGAQRNKTWQKYAGAQSDGSSFTKEEPSKEPGKDGYNPNISPDRQIFDRPACMDDDKGIPDPQYGN